MQTVEIISIPVNQLSTIIEEAVAKGIRMAKENELVEDEYISVSEARKMLGYSINQTVIEMCENGRLKYTCKFGKEREDGKAAKKTRMISKNSVIKFIKNKK